MTEKKLEEKNTTENIKLYSSKQISGATFLGGPLAAGYLVSENYKALNEPDIGRKALIIGIASTIILFGGIFIIPEKIIDSIPQQIIPLIYTGVIWGIVEWKLGDILKAHKEYNNKFYSGWKAFSVGLVSLVIIGIGIFGYAYLSTDNELFEKYDAEIATFSKNENETLSFYDNLNTKSRTALLTELDDKVIPKWKENIAIIKRTNAYENLPSELSEQNKRLLKYSELRIKAFELFRKAIKEDTDKYARQIENIHIQIDNELGKLE